VDLASITVAEEVAVAKLMNPFVLQRLGAPIRDEEIQHLFAAICEKLQSGDQTHVFILANEPTPAAYALPDGVIVVTRGLIGHLQSETELLTVLSHLLGHDKARHGIQLAESGKSALGKEDFSNGYAAAIASARFLHEPYMESEEIVADRYAAGILTSSGLDPALILTLLPKLKARLAALPDSQSGMMLKRHPHSPGRLKAVEEVVTALTVSQKPGQEGADSLFDELKSLLLESREGYELYQQALQLEKQGAVARAIGLYLEAAAAAPDEALILTGLGLAYMRQEAFVAARQHLTRAARLDSHYYQHQLGLGYIYLQQKDFGQAEIRLQKSQSLLPTALGTYFLARLYDEAADTQSALAAYQKVIRYFKQSQVVSLAKKRIRELESKHELE
jgi:predicted Zn-dependent protease